MQRLRYTVLGDGSSDRALIPILTWLLRQHCREVPILPMFADLRDLRRPPRILPERIQQSVELYPCEVLFVHRDAERESVDKRAEEIRQAVEKSGLQSPPPVICAIPVRMLEAWLLIDEVALRQASGNPSGNLPLSLPDVNGLETLQDPKETLYTLIRGASGLQGRRLRHFDRTLPRRLQQVADEIDNFGPLRRLAAFRRLEGEIERVAKEEGWAV